MALLNSLMILRNFIIFTKSPWKWNTFKIAFSILSIEVGLVYIMNMDREEDWLAQFEQEGDTGDRELAQHSWEAPLRRTWEEIEEDETGQIKSNIQQEQREERRNLAHKRRKEIPSKKLIEKGMIRYLFVVLDFSSAMAENDFRPSRKMVAIRHLTDFVREYFDQNPISHLGILVTHNKKAEMLTDLSGNPLHQIRMLEDEAERPAGGEFSLQNSLEFAASSLRQTPDYGCREIVFIMSSLSTCDPGDVFETIASMRKDAIRCSVISMTAEMHVCKALAQITNGTYSVALSESSFASHLHQHVAPPAIPVGTAKKRRWVHMGFPQKRSDGFPYLCECHNKFSYEGYSCPRCLTKLCELPTTCRVCSLTLVSSPHLARSYHHLLPIPFFEDVTDKYQDRSDIHCSACRASISPSDSLVLKCPRCNELMCWDCDVYIHEALHNCPGCQNIDETRMDTS